MNNIYIWHSEKSYEGAKKLFDEVSQIKDTSINVTIGTLPPKGYEGVLICWAPSVSKTFMWDQRKFTRIYNDYRKSSAVRDRSDLYSKLSASEIDAVQWWKLAEGADINNIHSLLGVNSSNGRKAYASTFGGGAVTEIASQEQLTAAIAEGKVRAFAVDPTWSRKRVSIITNKDGTFSVGAKEHLIETLTGEQAYLYLMQEQTLAPSEHLHKLCQNGVMSVNKEIWVDVDHSDKIFGEEISIAKKVCKLLELDFCTVEFVLEDDTNVKVIAVYTAPSLVSIPSTILTKLAANIIQEEKTVTLEPKTALITLAAEATEAEAATIMSLLERIKKPTPSSVVK